MNTISCSTIPVGLSKRTAYGYRTFSTPSMNALLLHVPSLRYLCSAVLYVPADFVCGDWIAMNAYWLAPFSVLLATTPP